MCVCTNKFLEKMEIDSFYSAMYINLFYEIKGGLNIFSLLIILLWRTFIEL